MATVTNIDTDFIKQITRDVTAQAGTTFPTKAYIHNSSSARVDDINLLAGEIQVDMLAMLVSSNKVSLTIEQVFATPQSFNRVYFCNNANQILVVVDLAQISTTDINEVFLVELGETNSVLT